MRLGIGNPGRAEPLLRAGKCANGSVRPLRSCFWWPIRSRQRAPRKPCCHATPIARFVWARCTASPPHPPPQRIVPQCCGGSGDVPYGLVEAHEEKSHVACLGLTKSGQLHLVFSASTQSHVPGPTSTTRWHSSRVTPSDSGRLQVPPMVPSLP